MTAAPDLAVTGSTGQLGALVARLLAQAGSPSGSWCGTPPALLNSKAPSPS